MRVFTRIYPNDLEVRKCKADPNQNLGSLDVRRWQCFFTVSNITVQFAPTVKYSKKVLDSEFHGML